MKKEVNFYIQADHEACGTEQKLSAQDGCEVVSLLKSGEYPRSLLENDDPDIVDADQIIKAFSRFIRKEGRYSFQSQ